MWKTSSVITIHKMGESLDSFAYLRPISLNSCVSKLCESIILSCVLFFLESDSILSPRQVGFRPGRSTSDQNLHLSQFILNGFNKPDRALGRFWQLSNFPKYLTLSGTPPFSTNLLWLASLLALLVELNLSFLIGALAWFIKFTKVVPFESEDVFRKDALAPVLFSLHR